MSTDFLLYFDTEDAFVTVEALQRELGVQIKCLEQDEQPRRWVFRFCGHNYDLRFNTDAHEEDELTVRDYKLRLDLEMPSRSIHMFLLNYAFLIKTLHHHLGIDESLLRINFSDVLARFGHPEEFDTVEDSRLVDKISGRTISYVELPRFISNLCEEIGILGPL